jgi:hypothetical protein
MKVRTSNHPSSIIDLEQKDLAFWETSSRYPLQSFLSRKKSTQKRISTAIGAKGRDFAFLVLSKK